MKNKRSIIQVITLLSIMLIVGTTLILGSFWTYDIVKMHRVQQMQAEENFLLDSKKTMETRVAQIIESAESKRNGLESRLMVDIQERTEEALSIAQNIYDENKGKLSRAQIETQIKNALRPIRYNEGRGYYFAVSMDGIEELYPVFPEYEGQNVLDLQDLKGNYVIRDEIKVIEESGKGYTRDFWNKPGADKGLIYPKITYVQYFEPLDWYIGTGEYIDDVAQDIKNEVLNEVNQITYGKNNDQTMFVTSTEGIELANGENQGFIGTSIVDLVDKDGKHIFQDELNASIKYPEGSYLNHSWFDTENKELSRETLTYVRPYEPWNWIVGTSIHTDLLETTIGLIREDMNNQIRNSILYMLVIVVLLSMLSIIILKRISARVKTTTFKFLEFFDKATTEHEQIDFRDVNFNELQMIANAANKMIRERKIIDEEIRKISITDGLTDVYNHQHILERLQEEMMIPDRALSTVLMDLDDFKQTNDVYGHLAGDEILRKVAATIKETLRGDDMVGRYGGEEFLLILPGANEDTAVEVAERVRTKVAEISQIVGYQISISGGVAEYILGESENDFVKRADEAMYLAKEFGKNRIERNPKQ
jgi:diguanylate cyclase (GGDEF)-like protein